MLSASNQKHGYLAVVVQVEYEERGTMWGLCGLSSRERSTSSPEISGLSQREEWA